MLYFEKGEYAEAEPLFRKAIQISEKTLGDRHYEVGNFHGNVGVLYLLKDDLETALKYFRKARETYLHCFDEDHPRVREFDEDIAIMQSGDEEAIAQLKEGYRIGESTL